MASYGEMTTVQMGSRTWVILNSDRLVKEIISKNCASTGDRPDFPVAGALVSNNKRTVLRKTRDWKEGRQLMHHLLSGTALKTYSGIQEAESTTLLHNYLHQPDQWHRHNYSYSYSIAHRIVVHPKHQQQHLRLLSQPRDLPAFSLVLVLHGGRSLQSL